MNYRKLFIFSLIFALSAGEVYAQKLHHTFDDWRVFTHKKDKSTFCYIASIPTKKSGNYNKRGEAFAMVTYRKDAADEISVSSGYPYKGKAKATIDGTKYTLFTKGERAWASSEGQDKKMAISMKRGSSMIVKGTSQRGTYSSDTYSLRGFTKALKTMKQICR